MSPYLKKIAVSSLGFLLGSCGIYNNNFDCSPGKGIGCKSVNEVLQFIEEKEEGEDLFLPEKKRVQNAPVKTEKKLVLRVEERP